MDLMVIRRRVLLNSGKKDYLRGVEWVDGKFITSGGSIANNANCHYTKDVLFLPQGEYALTGQNGNVGGINYRIHEYDENGKFVTQITHMTMLSNVAVDLHFVAPQAPHGIKLSIASAFVGTLTKA